jgi:hypothetical protein
MTGSYYYLWYGRPNIPVLGGGVWESGYTNNPLLGTYNSRDKAVISQHIKWAKEASLDFLIINWGGRESWDDITLKDYYLRNKDSSNIKFCLLYDSSITLNRFTTQRVYDYDFEDENMPGKSKGDKFLEDFDYLAENYFKHPQYFRIDGKPVVYIYNVSSFRKVDKYFRILQENMRKRGIELFLVADVVCWAGVVASKRNLSFLWDNPPKQSLKTISRALKRLFLNSYEKDFSISKYFSAISGYNLYSENRINNFLEELDSLYKRFKFYSDNNSLVFIPNVMPGYDDRKLKGLSRSVIQRENGSFYKKMFKIAKKYTDKKVPIVAITSFNEWHEGTELEPSKEEGDKYLALTRELK